MRRMAVSCDRALLALWSCEMCNEVVGKGTEGEGRGGE